MTDVENTEPIAEFGITKKKFVINFLKIIRKTKKTRKSAEEYLKNIEEVEPMIKSPDLSVINNDLEKICSVPHRRIGSDYSHEIEDLIVKTFKDIGLENVKKEPFDITSWTATNWKLRVETKEESLEIPCFYVVNTGFTSKEGINAPLVYVGTGTDKDFKANDVKGKIIVADIENPLLPVGKLLKLSKGYMISDPTNSIIKETDIVLTFALMNFKPQPLGTELRYDSVYGRAIKNGALGAIFILKDYPSNINTHWGPYDGLMKPLPALYVGKYDGIKLREIAQNSKVQASLILEGTKQPGFAHNIYGFLPGKSDDIILISSHHDSAFQGASEDGTGVAGVLAQARAWSQVPKEKRARSLLFLLSAGHLYAGIGAETFAKNHKNDILGRVLVDINLEHLCAKEVEEDPETHGYKETGNLALGVVFLSNNVPIIAHTMKSFIQNKIERMVLVPENFFATPPIGEAGHLLTFAPHINVVSFIRNPYYLLNSEDTLDKIDMSKMIQKSQCVIDIVNSFMSLPKEEFKKQK